MLGVASKRPSVVREGEVGLGLDPGEQLVAAVGGTFDSITEKQWGANCSSRCSWSAPAEADPRRPGLMMRAARWGRVINIVSMSVEQPIPGLIVSNSSAGAGGAKTLASEVAAANILVAVSRHFGHVADRCA